MVQVNCLESFRTSKSVQLAFIALFFLVFAGTAYASAGNTGREAALLEVYNRIEPELQENTFGVPLYLESSDQENIAEVDVYGIVDHPFSKMRAMLNVPANWCDIVSLPPNIKACTYRKPDGQWQLTLYSGRKFYQSPEDSDQVIYSFQSVEDGQKYMDLFLIADEGPLGTRDHRISFEAVPISDKRTFVHFRYTLRYGPLFRIAGSLYFETFGRDKVGFTVTGRDSKGEPVYVGGARGGIERNAVRYYFAIESFMDTINLPAQNRFSERVSIWYDRISRYKQLEEMDKKEYLEIKKRERKQQEMLQEKIQTGP